MLPQEASRPQRSSRNGIAVAATCGVLKIPVDAQAGERLAFAVCPFPQRK
jgi:hypothetical protein